MRALEIAVLFPHHLNLNGDLSNAGVFAKRAGWYGIASNVTLLDLHDAPPGNPDLIIVGHGSRNAWLQISKEGSALLDWLDERIRAGSFVLAVSTGFEFLAARGHFGSQWTSSSAVAYRSEFAVGNAKVFGQEIEVFGYLNSDSGLPLLLAEGRLIGTLLHGPILAKNPQLSDLMLAQIAGLQPRAESESSAALLKRIDSVVQEVLKLEKPKT